MKKFAKVMTALVLIMAMMVPIFASAEPASRTMYVKTSTHQRINMHDCCSYSDPHNVVTTIPYGKPVQVFDFLNNGTWAIVQYNGKAGYVMTRFLSIENPIEK